MGSAVAQNLARYELDIMVIERAEDVACGTSKANSGIVHAGYHDEPGSLMAETCVKGNKLTWDLASDLDVPHKKTGSLLVAFEKEDIPLLYDLMEQGEKNGVKGLKVLDRADTLKLEPNLNSEIHGALYAPSAGVISPYEYTLALAENASENGVEFVFDSEVTAIRQDEQIMVETNSGKFLGRYVLACAGAACDKIGEMTGDSLPIVLRKGEEYILDKDIGDIVSHVVFPTPTKESKGILVSPTADGNILIGPTSVQTDCGDDLETSQCGRDEIIKNTTKVVPTLSPRSIITSYAGMRAVPVDGDFVIKPSEKINGMIHIGGISSPGLTAAAAIADIAKSKLSHYGLKLRQKKDYIKKRRVPRFCKASLKEKDELIASDPAYGKIICRCEQVTEAEIRNAIRRPLGAKTLDGIKKRTRAGMGRCHGGFCLPGVSKILGEELGIPLTKIRKNSCGSNVFSYALKDRN